MDISVWISLASLSISITALIYSIRNGRTKTKLSFLEMRNSFRVNLHASTMEVFLLIEKIKNQAHSEQEVRIINKLIETADGMISIYEKLKKTVDVLGYISPNKLIEKYDGFSAELKEFNLILSLAKADYSSGNIDKLEATVLGLHVRMLGSEGSGQSIAQN